MPNLVVARVYDGGSVTGGEHALLSIVSEEIERDRVRAYVCMYVCMYVCKRIDFLIGR